MFNKIGDIITDILIWIIGVVCALLGVVVFFSFLSSSDFNMIKFIFVFVLFYPLVHAICRTEERIKNKNGPSSKSDSPQSNRELFDEFKKYKNNMTGFIQYISPKFPFRHSIYGNKGVFFDVNFDTADGSKYIVHLRFIYKYQGTFSKDIGSTMFFDEAKCFFVDSIIFRTDNNRYTLEVSPTRKNSNNNFNRDVMEFAELDTISLTKHSDLEMFKDLATSVSLKVRLNSKNQYKDFDFSSYNSRCGIIDAYKAYEKAIEQNPDIIMISD